MDDSFSTVFRFLASSEPVVTGRAHAPSPDPALLAQLRSFALGELPAEARTALIARLQDDADLQAALAEVVRSLRGSGPRSAEDGQAPTDPA